jgi:putative integral membrane protein (TIGR02587 family)
MLASKQLGESAGQERDRRSYAAQLFLMLAGALFLAFNLAPTEEMILISFRMSGLQAAALVLLSIGLLHALVYTVGFRGEQKPAALTSFVEAFFKFSLVGYAIVVLATLYILWTFGRTEDVSPPQIASMVAVLSFPGAVGAAIARLVV